LFYLSFYKRKALEIIEQNFNEGLNIDQILEISKKIDVLFDTD